MDPRWLPLLAAALTGLIAMPPIASSQEGNLLPNTTLEAAEGDLAQGWVFQGDGGEATGVRRESGGVDDSAYLEATVAQEGQCDFRMAQSRIDVKAARAYLLTCSVRASNVAAKSHSIELQWFGEGGFISRDIASATVGDKWVRIAVGPVAPPEAATGVVPLLRCYGVGTYGFDSVGLWEVAQVPPNILQNPGFESDANGDGLPDGWHANMVDGMLAGGIVWDTEEAHTGQCSARLVRPEGVSGTPSQWVQRDVPINASTRYELSAATKADEFGRELRIAIEWTKGGEPLDAAELRDQTSKSWQRKTLRGLAPPDAEHANIILESAGNGTLWFDDVTLTEVGIVAEIDVWLERPNARGLIREGMDRKELLVHAQLKTEEDGIALGLRLVDGDGKMLAESRPSPSADQSWRPATDGLESGAYRLLAEAVNAEGQVVASQMAPLDIVPADSPGIFFRDDHVAMVEGKPWFPIGVTSFAPTSEVCERLAASGFNLIVPGQFTLGEKEKVQEALDRARELGLYVIEWNNGHVYGDVTADERQQRFSQSAENAGNHAAFLGWLCDEALWNGVPLSKVKDAYLAARAVAPTLVFWQNQAPRNTIEDLTRYVRWADVTGMDIYPVEGANHSDLPNKTLSVVGDEMDKQHETTRGRKPVWAILQGFGWAAWEKDETLHKRAPTWEETRFMAYDAILHGATGIIYWGARYEDQESDIWNSLRRMAGELAELVPVLVAEERVEVDVEPADAPIIAEGRRVDGKLWIMAVNESPEPVTAQLSVPGGVPALELFAEEADAVTLQDGKLTAAFEPYGVHVYRQP
jgi:hypothetical protein